MRGKKGMNEDFRADLRENWGTTHRRREGAAINTRVVVLITSLLGLAYFFLR